MTTSIALSFKPTYNHAIPMDWLTERITFLRQVPLFAELTDPELTAIGRDFKRLSVAPGEAIFYEGDPGQVLYIVETGQVRIFIQNETGQEISVNVCGPGDLFGELAVIDQLPRSASATAMNDTTVLSLSREKFRDHMRRAPQLALNFMKALSVRVRYNTRQMDNLGLRSVPSRLARKLLELAQQHGVAEEEAGQGVRLRMTLTQSDLASMISATRESINKTLAQFRKQGLIETRGGHLIILDPEGLRSQSV